jgi:hypothetical protein
VGGEREVVARANVSTTWACTDCPSNAWLIALPSQTGNQSTIIGLVAPVLLYSVAPVLLY